jgi:histidinol dehydrogenase
MRTIEIRDEASYREAERRLCGLSGGVDAERDAQEKVKAVQEIIAAVRERGDAAVAEFTARFDRVSLRPEAFEVPPEAIDDAYARVDAALLAALGRAYGHIREFHGKHLRESWEEVSADGTVLGQRITPIASVGVYVPGGKAFYPSSVLMNIVPAAVAGVREIIMVSPPSYEGSIYPAVLAAAKMAGVTRVFRIGGAQAVAALAYGTEHVPAVLKITGPGNTYVTVAKRLVRTVCDIDSEAGPSEVVVIADETADPRYVAVELLAQAEHDEEARVALLTPSRSLAEQVQKQVEQEMATLPRTQTIRQSLDGYGAIVLVRSLEEAIKLTNRVAPEHVSIQTASPREVLEGIENAGAVMLGAMTPVAVGDYYAGPNHILPTGGRARFSSPLTAEDFRKVTNVLSYSTERLRQAAPDIRRLAEAEGLTAHARAVEVRL